MSPGAKIMEKGPDALGTVENEYGRTKHENGTRGRQVPFSTFARPDLFTAVPSKKDLTPSVPL
jgi:hypothetical protein